MNLSSAGADSAATATLEQGQSDVFYCTACGFESHAPQLHGECRVGRAVFIEEQAVLIRDPLSVHGPPLCIGGVCANCCRRVCASPACSFFYKKRFCNECARHKHVRAQLPAEMLRVLDRTIAPEPHGRVSDASTT